ncbi:MAG: ABC transporter permease, partial [Nitrospira sp.]|nr:ABC transporter permease [Nitrospira sp.]
MKSIDRKALRDLWHVKGQALAIAIVVAAGVGIFVAQFSTLESLSLSRGGYYKKYRFGEVFAHCKRAPDAVKDQIADIPGVEQVQTRLIHDVSLDIEGQGEPAIGRLISVPDDRRPLMNDVHIRQGRYLEPGAKGEVLVGEAFAMAHRLEPGRELTAVINGRRTQLKIVGIALSPEYVYSIRAGDFFPDDKRFGIVWMEQRQMAAALGMRGAFNAVSLGIARDASSPDVAQRLDDVLSRYGSLGSIERKDQTSHWYLENE